MKLIFDLDLFRRKSGNPGYMVLFNMGTVDATVNVTGFADIPETLSVVLRQPDPTDDTLSLK